MHRIDPETTYTAARELRDLLPAVQALIPHASNQVTESDTTSARAASVFRIPWHTPAAHTFYDIHAQTRRYENALTLLLFHHAKYRPGDDANTYDAISRLPVLIAHALDAGHDQHTDVTDIDRLLTTTWPRACRLVLDQPRPDDQPWTKAPGDIRCPYCQEPLQLAPGWQALQENTDVICRRCRDDNGHPYTWPITERIGQLQADELVTERTARHRWRLGSRLRVWHHRGRIHPYGRDDQGAKLYRVSDVLELLEPADEATA